MALLTRIGVGLGVGLGGFGTGAAGIGWVYSSMLLESAERPVFPERVLAADARTVMLAASRLTMQPGVWGLRWADGLAEIGPVLATGRREVVREWLGGAVPPAGTAAVLDTGPYDPDPAARGLDFEAVAVPGPLGDYPGWLVPGGDRPWVIMVHGRGGSLRESLRLLPALHEHGHPVLVISYRNDEQAPPSPDGHSHLGNTEWTDLQAAVEYVHRLGGDRVVLFGLSMGAAIIGAFLDRSPLAERVAAVVWDAPLVDWRATLRQQGRNRRLPAVFPQLVWEVTSRRIGIDFDHFDLRRRPPAVRPPTFIVHSDEDTAVPISATRALVADAPRLDWPLRLLEVPGVEHTGAWNADPDAYQRAVTDFLDEVLDRSTLVRRARPTAGTMGP